MYEVPVRTNSESPCARKRWRLCNPVTIAMSESEYSSHSAAVHAAPETEDREPPRGCSGKTESARVPARRRGASELGAVATLLARAVREAVTSAGLQPANRGTDAAVPRRRRGRGVSTRRRDAIDSAESSALHRRRLELEAREARVAKLESELLARSSALLLRRPDSGSRQMRAPNKNETESVTDDDLSTQSGTTTTSRHRRSGPSAVRVAHTAGAAAAAAADAADDAPSSDASQSRGGRDDGHRRARHSRSARQGACRRRRHHRACRCARCIADKGPWCDVCRVHSSRCRCERRTTSTTSCDHRGRCSTTVQNEIVRSRDQERTCDTCRALPCRCGRECDRGSRRCAPPYGCGRARSPPCQYRRVLQPVCGPLGCTLAETDLLTCRSRPGWAPGGYAFPYPAPCGVPPYFGPPVAAPVVAPSVPAVGPCGLPPVAVPPALPAPVAAACGPPDNLNGNLISFNERTLFAPDVAATPVAYL